MNQTQIQPLDDIIAEQDNETITELRREVESLSQQLLQKGSNETVLSIRVEKLKEALGAKMDEVIELQTNVTLLERHIQIIQSQGANA